MVVTVVRRLGTSRWLPLVLVIGATACGSSNTAPDTSSSATAPFSSSTQSITSAIEPTTTNEPTTTGNDQTTSAIEPTTAPAPADTASPVPATSAVVDRAESYLGVTTEIYRRTLPDGQDFVVRLSTAPYATVFGLSWTAPTGSAEQCLGDHAVFLGVPGDIGSWGSAWIATSWFDAAVPTQPAALLSSMRAAEDTVPATEFLLIRTAGDAAEVVLVAQDGSELDRAPVANDVAMVMVEPRAQSGGQTLNLLRVVTVAGDGQHSAPTSLLSPAASRGPSDCGPGDAPQRPLPAAGVQPADPAVAAVQIRQRHALLVDLSVSADLKPADLLDDDTGVQAAIAALDDSPYRDLVESAVYAIDELVFVTPDEAWFRYTITTSASTYGDRFGRAVFDGDVWQITRATICQDLALALAPCVPSPPTNEPPSTPEWEAAWREWVSRAMLYTGNDGCAPLSQC